MTGVTRIAVLCNNRIALPALHYLVTTNRLCGAGAPANNPEVMTQVRGVAQHRGVPVQAFDKKNLEAQLEQWIALCRPEKVFLMTFPWKIPATILQRYPGLFHNFHYGLLPAMRGSDPIFETLRRQSQETGVTIHLLDEGLDTGPILLQRKFPLTKHVTHGMLCAQLAYSAAQACEQLFAGQELNYTSQDEQQAQYYPKATAQDVCINWQVQDAASIDALVRACNPWNRGAYTFLKGWNLRVLACTLLKEEAKKEQALPPGSILKMDAEGLFVQCKDGAILKIDVVFADEGYFTGDQLTVFGVTKGDVFQNQPN